LIVGLGADFGGPGFQGWLEPRGRPGWSGCYSADAVPSAPSAASAAGGWAWAAMASTTES
jgi:hypothetical protein